jgi:hypothetical protein
MADTKISALTSATTPLVGTEVLPIVQSGVTVKVANNDLRPKQIQSNATSGVMQIAGPAAAATRVVTIPDANATMARTDAAQSFTGDQTLSTGNLVVSTSGKGVTTGSAIPLGLGVNNAVSAATIDTSSNLNVGQTTAITGAKLTINGQLATSPFIGINITTPTTVATGVSFLAVFRCRGSGGSAVVLYESGQTPVIISQTGTVTFVTGAPIGNQIQLANGGNSITALAGATVGTNNLNVTVIANQ